jgi:hypothetical protein
MNQREIIRLGFIIAAAECNWRGKARGDRPRKIYRMTSVWLTASNAATVKITG